MALQINSARGIKVTCKIFADTEAGAFLDESIVHECVSILAHM
jgi:hypothetical protein